MLSMDGVTDSLQELGLENSPMVAGKSVALEALRELIIWPRVYEKEAAVLGVQWPNGLLLYGPPGCGKTLMTRAVCAECNAILKTISAADIFGAYMGESEKTLRQAFDEAAKEAAAGRIVVLFFDEIDALCPTRRSERQHESRVVSQMLTLMDGASEKSRRLKNDRVVVVAATNRPNALDPALRRPGRFDREVEVSPPDIPQRQEILQMHSRKLRLGNDVSIDALAHKTHGYSGADLAALCREAAMLAISRCHTKGEEINISASDITASMKVVPPSITRSYEVQTASVSWDDIGGLEEVKKKLRQTTEWPLLHGEAFERLGIQPAKGILLYGPPGCCKTTLAVAISNGCKARLFSLSCAQVYSMYPGEGEAIARDVFRRARMAAPSIVLLDEVDCMACSRSVGERKGGSAERRVLSCLLTEMDGIAPSKQVVVVATTNRPEVLDSAILRPGRLDVLLFVGLPDAKSREHILRILTKDVPLHSLVDLRAVASLSQHFSGAELKALCTEAALCALREDVEKAACIQSEHFGRALKGIEPGVTSTMVEFYKQWGHRHKRGA